MTIRAIVGRGNVRWVLAERRRARTIVTGEAIADVKRQRMIESRRLPGGCCMT